MPRRALDASAEESIENDERHTGRFPRHSQDRADNMTSQRISSRHGPTLATTAVALLICANAAHAELVDIAWDASGRFERALDLAPATFAEVCGRLTEGQSIAWSFRSGQPLNFNAHYHEGKRVVFPVKKDRTAELDGELHVGVDQDYCWMWENPGSTGTTFTVVLRRR